jgi:hypothetical protein
MSHWPVRILKKPQYQPSPSPQIWNFPLLKTCFASSEIGMHLAIVKYRIFSLLFINQWCIWKIPLSRSKKISIICFSQIRKLKFMSQKLTCLHMSSVWHNWGPKANPLVSENLGCSTTINQPESLISVRDTITHTRFSAVACPGPIPTLLSAWECLFEKLSCPHYIVANLFGWLC